MKLIGWMHRKFRHNSSAPGDPFRGFGSVGGQGHPCNYLSGRPSLEDLQPHYPHHAKMPARASLHGMQSHRFFGEDDYYEDGGPDQEMHPPAMDELLLHGLLAIGTLGSAPGVQTDAGSATPTFGAPPPQLLQFSVDTIIAEKGQSETTERELKAINEELEKVLVPEPGDKNDRLSSARESHVSLKHLASDVCPLQGYLFGSPVEMAETTESAAERKMHRVSLGELFMRSRMTEDGNTGGKKGDDRENASQGRHLTVKKMLKRRGSKADAPSRTGAGPARNAHAGDVSGAPETKFQKIMQMFHRKVHPETSTVSHKKHSKSARHATRDVPGGDMGSGYGSDVTLPSAKCFRKDSALGCFKCQMSYPPPSPVPPAFASTCGNDSNGSREHWIKTDADYLVLEL